MSGRYEQSEPSRDRFAAALDAAGITTSERNVDAGHAIACWLAAGLAALAEAETDSTEPQSK